jgi:hypothetical protein
MIDDLNESKFELLKLRLHCGKNRAKLAEAVFLVVCNPPMNELWAT